VHRNTPHLEVSPIEQLFAFAVFLKITELAQIYVPIVIQKKSYELFYKMGLPTFWAIISKAPLVTLDSCV
jgi:hypothetical protein